MNPLTYMIYINTLGPDQIADILQKTFLHMYKIAIALKFVHKGPIENVIIDSGNPARPQTIIWINIDMVSQGYNSLNCISIFLSWLMYVYSQASESWITNLTLNK